MDLIGSVQPVYFYEGIRPPVKNSFNQCHNTSSREYNVLTYRLYKKQLYYNDQLFVFVLTTVA